MCIEDEVLNMKWWWLREDLDNCVVNWVFLNIVLNGVVGDMNLWNEVFWI